MKATRLRALTATTYKDAKNMPSYVVQVEFFMEDGKRKRYRRLYPSLTLAQQVRADMDAHRDNVLDCFNRGVEYQTTFDEMEAYADWLRTLSMEDRVSLVKMSPVLAAQRDPEAHQIVLAQRQQARPMRKDSSTNQAARGERTEAQRLRNTEASERQQRLAERAEAQRLRKIEAAARKQRLAEEKAEGQRQRLARQEERRAEKHRLKESKRKLHMQHREERRAQQKAQERAAAQERGLQAKARWEAKQRERHLSLLERQAEIQRNKEIAAARAEEFRRQKKAEAAQIREARRLNEIELRRQRDERREVEKRERDRLHEQRKEEIRRAKLFPESEDGVRPSIVSLEGAEVLLAYCAEGLLSQDEMFAIVKLDADPDEITRSLKAVTLSSQDKPLSERKLVMSNLVASMRLAYESIPVDEYVTRWSIRHWSQTVRREASLVMAGDNDQHEFMEYEPEVFEDSCCLA